MPSSAKTAQTKNVTIWHEDYTVSDISQLRRSESIQTTRRLHRLIPIRLQNIFRDLGGVKVLADFAAYMVGVSVLLYNPQLALQYWNLYWDIKVIRFEVTNSGSCARVPCYLEKFELKGCDSQQYPSSAYDHADSDRVLIFVHGGAWGSGAPWLYRLFAKNAAINLKAHSVLILGYPTYPITTIEAQAQCVSEAVMFIHRYYRENVKLRSLATTTYANANAPVSRPKYILMGHSSGANICCLAVHQMMQQQPPSLQLVDVLVGLSGVYNIEKHHNWEEERGLHEISPMKAAAKGPLYFDNVSPTVHLQQETTNEYFSVAISQRLHNLKVLLLHGVHDCTVPVTSTIEYADALRSHGIATHTAYPEYDHMDPIIEASVSSEALTSQIFEHFSRLID